MNDERVMLRRLYQLYRKVKRAPNGRRKAVA